MSDQIEEKLMELESEILTLNLDGVLELAHNMKLDESSIKEKSRFTVSKLIREAIEQQVSDLTEKQESMEYLESIKAFLGPPPLEDNSGELESNEEGSPEEKEMLELQEEIDKLSSKQKEIKSKLVDAQKKKNKGTDVSEENSVQLQDVLKVPLVNLEKSVLHRDFKIQGVVGGPGKLRSFWEDEVHIVVSRKGPDSPVYDVTSESKKKKPLTLHRNMLLPCDYLLSESAVPASRQRRVQDRPPPRDTSIAIGDSSSDDEDEFPTVSHRPQVQLNDNVAEVEENSTNTEQPVELQSEMSDEENPLAAEDNPIEERPEEADETQEEAPAEETLEARNEDVPVPGMEEETIGHNGADRPQRNRQAPQRLAYYAPGHPACFYCGAMITQFNQQTPQFLYHQPEQIPIPTPYQWH